jgi:hypothetical protein
MRSPFLLTTAAALLGAALLATPAAAGAPPSAGLMTDNAGPIEVSAQRRKRSKARRTAAPATQIACTRFGCRPIPPGCRIVGERTWDGSPSGFDAVVCPYR